MLDAFCQSLTKDGIRVYPPRRHILLCGGTVGSIIEVKPRSLRDAFLKGDGFEKIGSSVVLQIEEIQDFFDKDSPYIDLVSFETDIALICELVILFSESPGSFAELGCFSMVDEIYEKILVIVQNHYLSQSTFISKGPVANFRRTHDKSVYAIVDAGVGIANGDITTVNSKNLVESVVPPIKERLKQTEDRTTLDRSKFNHLCKFYVALLKEFYCLKDDELLLLLWELGFDVDQAKLDRVAFCCRAVHCAASTMVGYDRVHFAVGDTNEAAKLEFQPPFSDKLRRRLEIRQFWERTEPNRVAAVSQELS